jgi:hypothetical protein
LLLGAPALLVAAAVLAIKAGRSDGLTALVLITCAFTVELLSLLCDRRGRAQRRTSVATAIAEYEARQDDGADRHRGRSAPPT